MSWERKFQNIQSQVHLEQDLIAEVIQQRLEKLSEEGFDQGYGLFYLDHAVFWSRIENGILRLHEGEAVESRYIQKARIFNRDRELLIYRRGDGRYNLRLRVDGSGDSVEVMDDRQVLLGAADGSSETAFTELSEDAGSSGWVPARISSGKRAALITRNYIQYANDLLAGFVDSRLMDIEEVKES